MNTGSLSQVRAALAELGIRPNSKLGQNFLVDSNVARISIERADVGPGDRILEIGPGLGILTEALLQAGATLMSVEFDRKLFGFLSGRFADTPDFTLQHGDGLKLDYGALFDPDGPTAIQKVVANLPYASGTRMLVAMVQAAHSPDCIMVTVQREVAERICAAPGTSPYGLLSVWAQQAYAVKIEHHISARCFWPPPDVASSIVGWTKRDEQAMDPLTADAFYAFSKFAFSQRRKQIGTLLNRFPGADADRRSDAIAALERLGHSASTRPEGLSPTDWVTLSACLVRPKSAEE